MNKNMAIINPKEYEMGMSQELANALTTWEEHLSTLLQLSEATTGLSWVKADVLAHMVDKFGENSISSIATDIGEPPSTISAYSRVSRAFLIEKRNPMVSFTSHLQASFSDSYDENKQEFIGESRFGWVERAESENFSTRRLREEIKDHKEDQYKDASIAPTCDFCKIEGHTVQKYVFFCPTQRGASVKKMLHPDCFQDILNYIEEH